MNFETENFEILGSTNTEALERARAGATEGLCIIARQQTAGRGRFGRSWVSEPNAGLNFSVVLHPDLQPQQLPLVTLMAGVATHDAIEEFGIDADIKWVNDILVRERKIAGILAETTDTPNGTAVVVGIGINVRTSNYPPDLVTIASSMEDAARMIVRMDTLTDVLMRNLSIFYDLLRDANGCSTIIQEWCKRSSFTSGKIVKVTVDNRTFNGTTDGLQENGALRVKLSDGTIEVIQAGDVEQVRTVV